MAFFQGNRSPLSDCVKALKQWQTQWGGVRTNPSRASHHCMTLPAIMLSWQYCFAFFQITSLCKCNLQNITSFCGLVPQTSYRGTFIPQTPWWTPILKSWIRPCEGKSKHWPQPEKVTYWPPCSHHRLLRWGALLPLHWLSHTSTPHRRRRHLVHCLHLYVINYRILYLHTLAGWGYQIGFSLVPADAKSFTHCYILCTIMVMFLIVSVLAIMRCTGICCCMLQYAEYVLY